MYDLLRSLFDVSDFPARWHCGEWTPLHGWVHIVSDVATFLAYLAIPIVLVVLIRRREDLPFPRLFWLFSLFIFSCGTVHLIEACIFWWPAYRLSAVAKACTAAASWATVLALVPVLPKALELPRLARRQQRDLERAARDLEAEVAVRREVEHELRRVNESLERRVAERTDEVGASERRLRSLVEAFTSVVWSTDPSGDFVEEQLAWQRHTGQTFEAARGHGWLDAVHPDDRATVAATWGAALARGERYEAEARLWCAAAGRHRRSAARAVPVLDDRGRPREWIGTITDIEDRHQAEETFRRAVESAPCGMLVVAPSGRILLANAEALKMFGASSQQLLSRNVDDLVPPESRPDHAALRTTYLEDPVARAMGTRADLRARRLDGHEFPVEIGISPIAIDDRVHVLCSIVDISERKHHEEEIHARNRDLETLLHVTSHDLREPLRAIESFSRLLQDRYAERLDESGQDYLRRIVRGSQRLEGLIRDISELSRAQRMDDVRHTVSGEEIVGEALGRLSESIRSTDAEVHVEQSLPVLHAHRTWATQAIYNLLANSLKFTSVGQPPRIEIAGYAPASADTPRPGIVVRDRGPGVPEHMQVKIFDLFERAVGRSIEGTGAGLAIVREIAERHGGRAWYEPREGGGSCFIVTFGTPRDDTSPMANPRTQS